MLILRTAGNEIDYATVAYKYLGKNGWVFANFSFMCTYFVGCTIFFQVLSQSLYPVMLYILGKDIVVDFAVNWSSFSLSYSCLIMVIVMGIMTTPRDTTYIRKVNAFGVFFIIILLGFLLINGIIQFTKTDYTYSLPAYQEYKVE